ncbi:PEP-CTERM sorting domain-containing protein [Paucibacter sp. B2R-40]|uniref:PEP-CTERM sorting domain-containing protein n=1 Tax=Paucibacter sp. B2R-40 TaxID=2893554 RepID=UPI0021E3C43B|nr:PEP-CTERM sorting domain-containing protein [Paucibacter sp. B2R-40]MCV2353391.1 PEP-CTERM sorting domain-containing protein [Paucibacter sp. B2R-40]
MKQTTCSFGLSMRAALLAGLGFALVPPASAQAAWSSLSLVFTEPTGVVGPNDSIDVHVRFSNKDPSESFTLDSNLPLAGLNAADLPTSGTWNDGQGGYFQSDFTSYTSFSLTIGFGCSGSFSLNCTDGPPYNFSFAANPFSEPYVLAPGGHHDYLFGTFSPSAGAVAAGDYYFYRSLVWLNVSGLDAEGHMLDAVAFPASTCNRDSLADCQGQSYFTRTVVAVPEPESYALMLAGLGLLALRLRRRRGGA